MNVHELIEFLEEQVENGNGDRDVLIVHQENYPLQETVRKVWDPVAEMPAPYRQVRDSECDACGEKVSAFWWVTDDEGETSHLGDCCFDAKENSMDRSDDAPIYIVAGGHDYNRSPYGPAAAFNHC